MSDIRKALEGAFSEAEETDETHETETVEAAPELEHDQVELEPSQTDDEPSETQEPEAQSGSKGRDEKGRFAAKQAAAKEAQAKPEPVKPQVRKPAAAALAKAPALGTDGKPTQEAKPIAADAARAPQSWKAGVREKWTALPQEVQQEVLRRERETATALQAAAPARQFQEQFQRVVAPFEGMIRAEGGEPLKAVASLLQTAAALRTAPAAHKAALVANLIKTYGVPVEALDAALAGQPAQQNSAAPRADSRVDELFARVQAAEARAAQTHIQHSQRAVQEFQDKSEFFEDVREDMADMLELASKRGVALSLQDAYNRAIRMHPDISEVLRQRDAAKAAEKANASTQRARVAASSVRSQPSAGASGAAIPKDIRGAVEASIEKLTGR